MFDNGDILCVIPHEGLVAGQKLWYEMWLNNGTTILVKDDKDVATISGVFKEFSRLITNRRCRVEEQYMYLQYRLEELGW